jgi:hypothetical protein
MISKDVEKQSFLQRQRAEKTEKFYYKKCVEFAEPDARLKTSSQQQNQEYGNV